MACAGRSSDKPLGWCCGSLPCYRRDNNDPRIHPAFVSRAEGSVACRPQTVTRNGCVVLTVIPADAGIQTDGGSGTPREGLAVTGPKADSPISFTRSRRSARAGQTWRAVGLSLPKSLSPCRRGRESRFSWQWTVDSSQGRFVGLVVIPAEAGIQNSRGSGTPSE
jgi:hypothetical protein